MQAFLHYNIPTRNVNPNFQNLLGIFYPAFTAGYSSIILLLSTLSRAIFKKRGEFLKVDVSRWYQRTYGDAGGPRQP